ARVRRREGPFCFRSSLAPPPRAHPAPSAEYDSGQHAQKRGVTPGARLVPAFARSVRRELEGGTGGDHHQVAIETPHPSHPVGLAMPESFVVTLQAGLVGALDRLSAVDTKLNQVAHA